MFFFLFDSRDKIVGLDELDDIEDSSNGKQKEHTESPSNADILHEVA